MVKYFLQIIRLNTLHLVDVIGVPKVRTSQGLFQGGARGAFAPPRDWLAPPRN